VRPGPDSRSLLVVGSREIALVGRDGSPRISLLASGPTACFTGAIADPVTGFVYFSREGASECSPSGLFRWEPASGKEDRLSDVAEVPVAMAPNGRTLYVGPGRAGDSRAARSLAAIELETGVRREVVMDASRDLDFCLACRAGVGTWTRATLVDVGWAQLFPGGLRGTTRGMHPTLSPDGRFLVVERTGRLVLVDLATGSERDLGAGLRPSWSP
jgi:hypothetical protein